MEVTYNHLRSFYYEVADDCVNNLYGFCSGTAVHHIMPPKVGLPGYS